MIKYKKSQSSHVEVMISFAIFIGALAFVFIYINPLAKTSTSGNDNLDSVEKIIMEKLSYSVGKLSVVSYDAGGCYYFDASKYPSTNYREVLESSGSGVKKYSIYFSNIFNSIQAPNLKTASTCLSTNYVLGVFTNDSLISYDALKAIKTDCDNGCVDFKKSNGINYDFSFNCKTLSGTPIADLSFTKSAPFGVEVGSKEFPIRAIDSNANINEMIFNLKVW